jgi:hypothetical protein
MSPYETSGALRTALEQRLLTHSREQGVDLERLRRRAVFERLLARLEHESPGIWIVKGGMALEVRLEDRARMTRDLDLVARMDGGLVELSELLRESLAADPDGDGFEFRLDRAAPISSDEAGQPGWSFSIEARLDGRRFSSVLLQIVLRENEVTGTIRAKLPSALSFAGFEPVEVELVDPPQHFAEKLHAYTREYGERPNTRVKDLPDLVILIEQGLDADAAFRAAEHVFRVRETHELPQELADPPAGWEPRYARYVDELDVGARTSDEAIALVRGFWREAIEAAARG